jgi:AcrR family transcriptional regulator
MSAQESRPAPEEQLTPGARRILDVASELFYWRGIHAVGVDTIAAESGVTKRTLYDRFGSKDNLVATYRRRRDRRWRELIDARLAATAEDAPATRVLVPFDVLPQWLGANERGCSFINAFAELPEDEHPGRQVIVAEKTWLRDLFRRLLTEAGAAADDAATTATQLLSLHEGAIVSFSIVGAADAAQAARGAAERLVAGAVAAA